MYKKVVRSTPMNSGVWLDRRYMSTKKEKNYACVGCNCKIPPGKDGRKCLDCRSYDVLG